MIQCVHAVIKYKLCSKKLSSFIKLKAIATYPNLLGNVAMCNSESSIVN